MFPLFLIRLSQDVKALANDQRHLWTKGQTDDGKPRLSEDDIQRGHLGPRGVPGQPDPAKMTPQREKKTPKNIDPGHTT
jgi:hypothetical protein